jgi:hypothetical protein
MFTIILSLCSSISTKRSSFTPIQDYRQNYSFVYFNFFHF